MTNKKSKTGGQDLKAGSHSVVATPFMSSTLKDKEIIEEANKEFNSIPFFSSNGKGILERAIQKAKASERERILKEIEEEFSSPAYNDYYTVWESVKDNLKNREGK